MHTMCDATSLLEAGFSAHGHGSVTQTHRPIERSSIVVGMAAAVSASARSDATVVKRILGLSSLGVYAERWHANGVERFCGGFSMVWFLWWRRTPDQN